MTQTLTTPNRRTKTPSQSIVRTTWRIIETRKPYTIAAAFALCREEIIPDMFRSIAGGMQTRFPKRMGIFSDYLERHIALDGDQSCVDGASEVVGPMRRDSRRLKKSKMPHEFSLLALPSDCGFDIVRILAVRLLQSMQELLRERKKNGKE